MHLYFGQILFLIIHFSIQIVCCLLIGFLFLILIEIIEKLEYDQPITETHRITPFDTRFIQGQHQFHPHQFQ